MTATYWYTDKQPAETGKKYQASTRMAYKEYFKLLGAGQQALQFSWSALGKASPATSEASAVQFQTSQFRRK